jgi:putative redox protein
VLYALAGCTGMDVISILEKKRQVVTDLQLVVHGTQREDDYPHYYARVEVEYIVTGVDVKPEAVARAIELSEEKYCSVRGMFGPQVEVVTSYRVIEAER